MAKSNTETKDIETQEEENQTEQPQTDDPLKDAREANNTWTFKGKEYELYLVNQTGGIALPIQVEGETVGIVGAEFMWTDSEPFIRYLDFGFKNETNVRENVTQSKNASEIIQGARFFRDTLQKGFFIEFDEIGNRLPQQDMTRDELLAEVSDELQADLAIQFLTKYTIKRHFPEGSSKFRNALKPQDSIFFEFYLGDIKNPRHALLLEFQVPSKDARADYTQKARYTEREQDGDIVTVNTVIDNEYKLRFARKYFKSAGGVTLNQVGVPFDEKTDQHTKDFKKGFNPRWMIALADELVDAFHITGK